VHVRLSIIAAGLIAVACPGLAEVPSPDAAAARNAINWEVFQKLYPKRAIQAHEEGAVGFLVTLDSKGDVTDCQVTHSSGHPLLDQETCRIITLHAQFNADPGISQSQARTHEGIITWKLPDSRTPLQAPTKVAATGAPEKIICKKNVKTGTLAGSERYCLTQREWNRQSDNAKEMWNEVQGKKGFTAGN